MAGQTLLSGGLELIRAGYHAATDFRIVRMCPAQITPNIVDAELLLGESADKIIKLEGETKIHFLAFFFYISVAETGIGSG